MIPGELLTDAGEIELNEGRETITVEVANSGDRPIQIGSHYHFFETNPALRFERDRCRGFRLNIAAGTAVRFEPGQSREVEQVSEKNRENEFLLDELRAQNADLSERIKKLQERKLDIKSHPDYKALVRKYELRAQQRDHLQNEITAATEQLATFPPEDRTRMEDEIRFLTRKLDATQEKLRNATADPAPSSASGSLWLQGVRSAFEQWKTNLVLLRTYARDLHEIDASKIPKLRKALDGIEQLVTLLHSDGLELEEELGKIPEETADG